MSQPILLHHAVDGPADAPVLVLSGSLGSTVEMWRPNLAGLAQRLRVIRLDHRGHGGSPVPPGPYRITDLAGDALVTLDALGVGEFAWCGLSMGGMVGMHLASEHPERVRSLTLCCTTAHFPDTTVWTERIAAVADGGTAPLAPAVVARWFTPDWASAHPSVVTECEAMVAATPDDGYLASCQALVEWDHRDRLATVTAPTLVVAGDLDQSTPIEPHARILVDGIPGAHLTVLPAAHLATVERSDDATRLIADHAMLANDQNG